MNRFDVVIPYMKNSSKELYTCIDLIKKNFPVRYIHILEEFDRVPNHYLPHINQILKLKRAIETIDLTEDFYLFNDDFFVMEPVTGTPYYHKGSLAEHIASRPRDSYTRSLEVTAGYLSDDALSYEVHLPFLMNKKKLDTLLKILEPAIRSGKCPHIRSVYGNMFNVGGELTEDVKNPKEFEGKVYLSTTDTSFRREIGDYIRSKV